MTMLLSKIWRLLNKEMNKLITILLSLIATWNCSAAPDTLFPTAENRGFNSAPFEKSSLGQLEILPADAAFAFSSQIKTTTPSMLVLHWEMPQGYYLYSNKFQFVLNGEQLNDIQLPPPTNVKDDTKYGKSEVYEGTLEIKLPLQELPIGDASKLEITYQGCADNRLCYPEITKTVDLPKIAAPIIQAAPYKASLAEPEFLKADEAFIFSAELTESSDLKLSWKIADGYYLYREKLQFSLTEGGELATAQYPPSILKEDPVFGSIQIYKQPLLEIIVPLKNKSLDSVTLSVKYQGCAFAGLCYPPTTKVLELSKGANNINLSEQDRLAKLLANANVFYTLLIFFGLGLLLSLTPCVFPMIPILSGIIVGQGKNITTYKAFWISLIYVIAMAMTYAIFGVLTALIGGNLSAAFQTPWVLISFSLVFVLLSFSMFGFYKLELPSSLQTKLATISQNQQGGTLIGVAIMGILSALIVGPCVAAPLLGALIYISKTGDTLLGGLALFSMGMGMGAPLILVGMSAGHWLPKAGHWMESVKTIFGIMLLAVAIWMLERIIPAQATMLLWASLLIISAVYMGVLDNLSSASGWSKFWKGLGVIFFIYGILLIIGAASGNTNPLQPLLSHSLPQMQQTQTVQNSQEFKPIKGIKGLEGELAAAKAENKPVMLDFTAKWCASCKEMDAFTFADAGVQALLRDFIILRADVTANDEQDKALNKRFQIFGPPMVLFFDSKGQEQQNKRVVGFMPAEEFRQHLKKVIQ